MTQIITTSSTTIASINISAAVDEFIFIAEGVNRISETNFALRGLDGGSIINILGTLVSGGNDAIQLQDSVDGNGAYDITIGVTGSVIGSADGVELRDNVNTLTNHGQIIGGSRGIDSDGVAFHLTNTSTITSTSSIGVLSNGSSTRIINSGTISSELEGIVNTGDSFRLTNTGTIASTFSTGISYNGNNGFIVNGSTGSVIGNSNGFNLSGSDNALMNSGEIVGGVRGVVNIGDNFHLTNTGTITADGVEGVLSIGTNAHIINHGLIQSLGTGSVGYSVELRDNVVGGDPKLTNHGTISSAGGTAVLGDFDDADQIFNFGTIIGDIDNGGGDDLVVNGGRVQGDVLLGDDNDTYNGEGGHVTGTIDGGNGNDLLIAGNRSDRFDGGDDTDTVSYQNSLHAVSVNLQTGTAGSGDAAGDTLTAIENLIGSGGNDYLAGDSFVNLLDGGHGDDTLFGRLGADTLEGRAGNDRLFGGMGDDTLNGGADDDLLIGGAGGDDLNGGDGIDTADYSASSEGVNLNLHTGVFSGGDAAGDTLTDIEIIIGSSLKDDIAGTFFDDVLDGGASRDRLQGRLGNDDLKGGGGNDILLGGVNEDTLNGGTGNDDLTGGTDNDLFVFEDSFGNDKIHDFNDGNEFIDVSAVTGASTATLNVTGGGGSSVFVDFGGLDSIELTSITDTALITADDFIF